MSDLDFGISEHDDALMQITAGFPDNDEDLPV